MTFKLTKNPEGSFEREEMERELESAGWTCADDGAWVSPTGETLVELCEGAHGLYEPGDEEPCMVLETRDVAPMLRGEM